MDAIKAIGMSKKRVFVVVRLSDMDVSVHTTRTGAATAAGCNRNSIRGDRVTVKGCLVVEADVCTAKMGYGA